MQVFTKKRLQEVSLLLLGAFLLALSINMILLPNRLAAGGASGISIILQKALGIPVELTLYSINIPLLVLAFMLLGKEVGVMTVFGSLIYPFFVQITADIPALIHNQLLAAIFGGILTGLGLGLVFKGNASTGGTAILAQIISKYFHLPIGLAVSLIDGCVILGALVTFNIETVLYSLICLFVMGRVVDIVQTSFNRSKNVLIISTATAELKPMILKELNRGVTEVSISGGYGANEGTMLMCVLSEQDYYELEKHVLAIDPHSFIVVMPASEVKGHGFSLLRRED